MAAGSGNIKGITIQIGGDTTELGKALKAPEADIASLSKELKEIDNALKFNPGNMELLAQKADLTEKEIEALTDKLKTLKDAMDQNTPADLGDEKFRALQREVIKTESQLQKLKSESDNTGDELKDLASQADRAEAEIEDLGTEAKSSEGKLQKMGDVAKTAMGNIIADVAGRAADALVDMGKAVLDNADELQRQSDVTGLSAERLQELQYAGNNLGVELDTITGAQAKLTKSMLSAKNGTGAQADAFKMLGISVTNSDGSLRDAKTVMEEAITALGGMANETERDAAAMQLFGKSAMELNPLIKAGGDELRALAEEARNSGAVMSDEAVSGIDSFGDSLENLKAAVQGKLGELFAAALPGILEFVDRMKAMAEDMKPIFDRIKTIVETALKAVQEIFPKVWNGIMSFLQPILTKLSELINTIFGGIKAFIDKNGAEILQVFTVIWGKVSEYFGKTLENIKNVLSTVLETMKGLWEAAFKVIQGAWDIFAGLFAGDWKRVWEGIKGVFEGVWDAIVSIFKGAVDIGKDLIRGIWDGIKSMGSWIWSQIEGFFGGLVDDIKGLLGIHSPSTVFAGIGENMADGLGMGWEKEIHKVQRELNATAANAFDFHAGANVSPAKMKAQPASISQTFNFTMNATISNNMDIERVATQVSRRIGEKAAADIRQRGGFHV
jgi:phage-related minor tail protein